MKRRIFLLSLSLLTMIVRFWAIDKIPPLISTNHIQWRFLSAGASLATGILIYFFARDIFQNKKVALLSLWVFALAPWSFEQGRLYSQANFYLPVMLLILIAWHRSKTLLARLIYLLLFLISLKVIYPHFWFFDPSRSHVSFADYVNNIMILTSADMLFFKNITFWFGGVREWGILFLSFLPFLLLGFYTLIKEKTHILLSWFIFILFLAALSPYFPESREFYLVVPVLSLTVAYGIDKINRSMGLFLTILQVTLFIWVMYDIFSFTHYYAVHYPAQVQSNLNKINDIY